MALSASARFALSQSLVPALINAGINGWIAWAMHGDQAAVRLWGHGGYSTDLVATGVLLPGITWLILWPLLRRQAAGGKAPATDGVPPPRFARLFPGSLWRGSAVVGIVGGLVGAASVAVMHALGAPEMSGGTYAVFKGLYGGMLPVLLQPAMAWRILRSAPPAPAPALSAG